MEEEVSAFLEHHGVKGMKWGIRNTVSKHIKGSKFAKHILRKHASNKSDDTPLTREDELILELSKPKTDKERKFVKTYRKETAELDRLDRESRFKTAEQMGPEKMKRLNYLAPKYMG